MMDLLNILLSDSFWAASLRIATPLIFGILMQLFFDTLSGQVETGWNIWTLVTLPNS